MGSRREHITEQMRRLYAAERRSPVENAVYAFAALSSADKVAAVAEFNRIFERSPSVPRVQLVRKDI